MIFAASFDIVYRQGFAIEDVAPETEQYLPSSEFLSRKRRQDDSAGIRPASIKGICVTQEPPALFERIRSALHYKLRRHGHLFTSNGSQPRSMCSDQSVELREILASGANRTFRYPYPPFD